MTSPFASLELQQTPFDRAPRTPAARCAGAHAPDSVSPGAGDHGSPALSRVAAWGSWADALGCSVPEPWGASWRELAGGGRIGGSPPAPSRWHPASRSRADERR